MKNNSIARLTRSLHRDIGFLLIGLTIIYALSGMILTFRETDFLKSPRLIERTIPANIPNEEIPEFLHIRDFKIVAIGDDVINFTNGPHEGIYNKTSGIASYTDNTYPPLLNKLNQLHMTSNKDAKFWFTITYGTLLLFLAISSLAMYKPGTKQFKRGIVLSSSGVLLSLVLLI